MIFTYTLKQQKALKIFNDKNKIFILCEGGSRSGKTFLICDYIIARAIKYPKTRHVICRQSKTSCREIIWTQTFLKILNDFDNYPSEIWEEDKTNTKINFWNGSSIWAGGFDNKQHKDAILGTMRKNLERMKYPSPYEMLKRLKQSGQCKIYACTPTMEMFGVKKEDLVPEIDSMVGAATFLSIAADADVNLFI